MPGLLRDLTDDDPLDAPRTTCLVVDDTPYSHTAAKFWPGLIDEMITCVPGSTMIKLTAPSTGPLTPDLLFPENALQRQLDALENADLGETMADALAELNLLGPPSPVLAHVYKGRDEQLTRTLPPESLDAETFATMMAWLYQWAGLAATRWNDTRLSGTVTGKDPDRERIYCMTFSSTALPMTEGLINRSLSLVPRIFAG